MACVFQQTPKTLLDLDAVPFVEINEKKTAGTFFYYRDTPYHLIFKLTHHQHGK